MSERVVVPPSVEGTAYASLTRRPISREERYALGKARRHDVPRSSLPQPPRVASSLLTPEPLGPVGRVR